MRFSLLRTLVLFNFLFCYFTFADVYYLPRSEEDLPSDTIKSKMLFVPEARVAYFNRFALERDFPFLKGEAKDTIERWIVDNCAYISEFQLRLNDIRQTKIEADPKKEKYGFRQPGWYRAATVPVTNLENSLHAGLIDVKGVGFENFGLAIDEVAKQISLYDAANNDQDLLDALREKEGCDGLVSFPEAIAEIVRAETLQKIFDTRRRTKTTFYETVETYFVIVLPFELLKRGTSTEPTALIGRQAHSGRNTSPRRIRDKLYIDPLGGKQFDGFGASVDMECVFPTAPAFIEKFLTQEQIMDLRRGITCKELFDHRKSIEWERAKKTATSFLQGRDDAIYSHVAAIVGDRVERTPCERLKFRLDFDNNSFEYEHLSIAISLAKHGRVDFYIKLLQSSNWRLIKAATRALQQIKLDDSQIYEALIALLGNKKNLHMIDEIADVLKNMSPDDRQNMRSLADLLSHPHDRIRSRAASLFVNLPTQDSEIHKKLARALKDRDNFVRSAVLVALSQGNPDEQIQLEMAESILDKAYSVKIDAIEALIKLAPTNAEVRRRIAANADAVEEWQSGQFEWLKMELEKFRFGTSFQ